MNSDGASSLLSKILPGPRQIPQFPQAKYYATLGELAEEFGGTTSVLFHRSNAIYQHTGHPIDVLVFGPRRDYEEIDRKMHATGQLAEGVHFRSMWSELAVADLEASNAEFEAFNPLGPEYAVDDLLGEGVAIQRFRKNEKGRTLQVDMLRADGTIIVSDRRDAEPTGKRGSHSLILCDKASRPVREFDTLDALRFFWLDRVIGKETSVVFSDSFRVAATTHGYRRPNVTVVQTFHNNHLHEDSAGPLGYTKNAFIPFLSNIDAFDATVHLSDRQLADIDQLMGPAPHRWVIHNSRRVDFETPRADPERTAGVMLGRLTLPKQIDHAIEAVAQANTRLIEPITLDVYGEGDDRERLEDVIAANDTDAVVLRGYDPTAPEKFATASFSILPSRSEALPLVLVESMARGCVPIAYDVRYGPSEIITNGVNGFLVEPDDVRGLAAALVTVQSMSKREISRMRRNARKRAKDFSDAEVLSKWSELLTTTIAAKQSPKQLKASGRSAVVSCTQETMTISFTFTPSRPMLQPRAHFVLNGRKVPAIMRFECELTYDEPQVTATKQIPVDRLAWFTEGVLDVSFELHDAAGRLSHRVPADGAVHPFGNFEGYATTYGNLSLRLATVLDPADMSAEST
ncbi:glycosyltransferase [Brevibacterium sp. CBA3109]|uniref:Glycosyltransferase n=1 Tax=Brevibacterium koreense TaxID=3140787 RepID=A0AAU7UKB8_9MICO